MVAQSFEHALAWDGIILASIGGLLTGSLHETLVLMAEWQIQVLYPLWSSSASFK